MDADARIRGVQQAFEAFLLPRLEEDTRRHREQGHVFYQGRWMPEREADRIHYLLKRDAERSFIDLIILDLVLLAGFALLFKFPGLVMVQLLG